MKEIRLLCWNLNQQPPQLQPHSLDQPHWSQRTINPTSQDNIDMDQKSTKDIDLNCDPDT